VPRKQLNNIFNSIIKKMEKKYCPTHHLYYTGFECPLCLQEKSEALARRFYTEPVKVEIKKDEPKEVTEESLAALVAKFNKR